MADWNKPVTSDTYTDHFGSIRDKDTSLVKMLDGTSDTNLPTGAKRKNSGQKYRLEEWDGTSWNMVEPGFGNASQQQADWLGGLGSAPLEDDDLAANGGNVVTDDQTNDFAGEQRIISSGSGSSGLSLRTDGDGQNRPHVVWDDMDGTARASIRFVSDGANSRLVLGAGLAPGALNIAESDESITVGSPPGGYQGAGTINAEGVYDNDNRVAIQPGSSSDPGLAIDTWRTPNANRATYVLVQAFAATDGGSDGSVKIEVDESGGTSADYDPYVVFAPAATVGSNTTFFGALSVLVPAGGSYRITENGPLTNSIQDHREMTL